MNNRKLGYNQFYKFPYDYGMDHKVIYNIQKGIFEPGVLYIANSGFPQKDKISLIKLNKTTGDIKNLLDLNYVPIPNRPNQIRSRMEYGAMTQVNATVFICGTLHKYNE